MEKTPTGTAVGVDDPYAHVERCDYLTDDGRCRYAIQGYDDGAFVAARAADDYACPVVADVDGSVDDRETRESGDTDAETVGDGPWHWRDCPQFRSQTRSRACIRCGIEEVRMAHDTDRPLLEEHHLSYRDAARDALSHEITVSLCRWCHARVHSSWARIDDDVSPAPEAMAAREERRSRELDELGFTSARARRDGG